MHHFLEGSDRLRTNGVGDAAEEVDLVFAIDAAAWEDVDGGVDVGGEEIPFACAQGMLIVDKFHALHLMSRGKLTEVKSKQIVIDVIPDGITPVK